MKNIKRILSERIFEIKLSDDEFKAISKLSENVIEGIEMGLKKKKIKADVFVGGSLAKNTLLRKKKQDIDLFVRFDKKYDEKEISGLLSKVVKGNKIHGSRDYFIVNKENIILEIIPVMNISKPEQASNVTDLSFFHVKYVEKQIKKHKNLNEEIMLAKDFCHANNCYGAESFIKGFSGYALELLIIHYKSFLKFIKEIVKLKEKKVIDIAGFYKGKNVLWELNESKLKSPVVLIDPTFKERNALAGLGDETFEKFQKVCERFLKNPSEKFFESKDLEGEFRKKYKDLIIVEAKTNRQKGDIAGTKLRKFSDFFSAKLKRYFDVKFKDFEYDEDRNVGRIFLVLKKKDKLDIWGPPKRLEERSKDFKKAHRGAKVKNGKWYVAEKNDMSLEKFVNELKGKYKKSLEGMGIERIKIN